MEKETTKETQDKELQSVLKNAKKELLKMKLVF